jgi:uncharacterized membrane protein YvbJ
MFCNSCGKQNKDGTVFCAFCGKAMSQNNSTTPQIQIVSPKQNSVKEKSSKSRLSFNAIKAIVTAVIIVVLVLIVLVIYYPSVLPWNW